MPEIQLQNGHTATVREVDEMQRGHIRAAFKLADKDGASPTPGELGMDTVGALQDAVLTQFIVSWTLTNEAGNPKGITMRAIKELGLKDYNTLQQAAAPVLADVMSTTQETPDPTRVALSSTSAGTDSTND